MNINIKEIREKHELTQAEMAKILGCTQEAISRWETGAAAPSAKMLMKIIIKFKLKIEECA